MLINKDDYTETINNVADHLREKHPDHLLLFQHRQIETSYRKPSYSLMPYYWDSVSYKFLKGNGFDPLPIDGEQVVMAAYSFCHSTQKPVIIIDNTITVSPYYQIIHPLKQDHG